jgi:hypothetical protein
MRAELVDPRALPLGFPDARQAWHLAAAPASEVGNGIERCLRRTEAGDELAVGDWANRRRSDQPNSRY